MVRVTFLCLVLWTGCAGAAPLRVAIYTAELDRDGPGLLLRDIRKDDAQVLAVARVIAAADPDVILLTRFDWDLEGRALAAFAGVLAQSGASYPHRFAPRPNTGWLSGADLNGDGRLRLPEDGQGWGRFSGHNGMAILSKWPIRTDASRDFSGLLWADLPGAQLPVTFKGTPVLSPEAQATQRLSTTGHWAVPVDTPDGPVTLLVWHATPPVFDGPEDRNGLRNRDEARFWPLLIEGRIDGEPPPDTPFVLLGNANLDPQAGDGRRAAMAELLAHPALQDPRPTSAGGAAEGRATDTVAWDQAGEPGNMRVDYVLPQAGLEVSGAGVLWPAPGDPARDLLGHDGRGASRHRLVWVDLMLRGGS
ncbi:endonuclease/exonuclease/phosphatase family protein [Fluviibacterium sp. DFM31]|uniref:Endonuclease/exonuclease/phosphatase family protein n=2 Tax=Meridianimarinicoccus marinus TaxID=3231483 RepID=A0ABV3LA41_9RHOB